MELRRFTSSNSYSIIKLHACLLVLQGQLSLLRMRSSKCVRILSLEWSRDLSHCCWDTGWLCTSRHYIKNAIHDHYSIHRYTINNACTPWCCRCGGSEKKWICLSSEANGLRVLYESLFKLCNWKKALLHLAPSAVVATTLKPHISNFFMHSQNGGNIDHQKGLGLGIEHKEIEVEWIKKYLANDTDCLVERIDCSKFIKRLLTFPRSMNPTSAPMHVLVKNKAFPFMHFINSYAHTSLIVWYRVNLWHSH